MIISKYSSHGITFNFKKKTDQLKLIVDLVLHSCLKFKFISFIMIMLTFTMENRVQQ